MWRTDEAAFTWPLLAVQAAGHDHDKESLRESLDDAPRVAAGRRTRLHLPCREHLAEHRFRLVVEDHAAGVRAHFCVDGSIDLKHSAQPLAFERLARSRAFRVDQAARLAEVLAGLVRALLDLMNAQHGAAGRAGTALAYRITQDRPLNAAHRNPRPTYVLLVDDTQRLGSGR